MRRIARLAAKTLGAGALFVVVLLTSGMIYQRIGSAADAKNVPVSGKMVDLGDRAMHLRCSGTGSPTVILEAGAIGFADTFARLQPKIAGAARVCSYDRAGLGWSDISEETRSGNAIARDLHELLAAAGEQPPYILVGHSLGGLLIRAYTAQYPEEVVALGFIDPAHPDQLNRFPVEFQETFQKFVSAFAVAPTLAEFGVLRIVNPMTKMAADLPEPARRTAEVFASSPKHLRSTYAEYRAWDRITADAANATSLGDRPVVVLSASIMNDLPATLLPINHQMHREIAALSTRGRHEVIEGSDHYSILMREQHANQTAAELLRLVEDVRG